MTFLLRKEYMTFLFPVLDICTGKMLLYNGGAYAPYDSHKVSAQPGS